MMDWTDRHCRYFMRCLSPSVGLYTEMVTAAALRHGDKSRLLAFDKTEHPVALQVGGSEPTLMPPQASMRSILMLAVRVTVCKAVSLALV